MFTDRATLRTALVDLKVVPAPVLELVNDSEIPFTVSYLVADHPAEDRIKVYDRRFKHTEHGQVIGEVYTKNLNTDNILDFAGIDVWYFTPDNMQVLRDWAATQKKELQDVYDNILDIASGVVDAIYAFDTGDTEQPANTADMADDTVTQILQDSANFYLNNKTDCDLAGVADFYSYEHIGQDFWLTRNGHGAGFWDGDLDDELGNRLSEACKVFGECNIYEGDDELIYMG